MVVVTAFILLTNIISHISSAQRQYVLELLSSNSAKSWSQCNTLCGQLYGTELATIISQEDRASLVSYAQSAGQYLWIGLTDQQSEGNWKWIDGTPCTIANGDCSEFWTTTPNDFGDVMGASNADCGFWDTNYNNGAGTLGEANCVETTIYDGGYLCNANACNIVIDGASECTRTSNCASNQRCNDRSNTGTLIPLIGSTQCAAYCTCYCLDIPTTEPTLNPSAFPSSAPTLNPSSNPTSNPSAFPSSAPTRNPSSNPSIHPTKNPTFVPTQNSTKRPTKVPTKRPIKVPTISKDDPHVGMAMDETSCLHQLTAINVAPIQTDGMNRKSFYLLCAIISAVGIICCVMLISMIFCYKWMTIKKNVRRAEAVIGLTQTSASPSIVSAAKKNKQQNIETILMKTNQVSKEGVNTADMNTLDIMGKNDDGTAVDNDSDSDSDGLFAPQCDIKTTHGDTTQ